MFQLQQLRRHNKWRRWTFYSINQGVNIVLLILLWLLGHGAFKEIKWGNQWKSNLKKPLQIKTTMGYHYMSIRMSAIQKSTSNKCWKGCGEKGTLLHCWWECKLVQPLWRTVWRFLKNLELELPYDPAILLLGIHTEETRCERDTCTPMFIAALFIIARTWKQPRCPSADEWIRKLWYIYTMDITQPLKRIHLN